MAYYVYPTRYIRMQCIYTTLSLGTTKCCLKQDSMKIKKWGVEGFHPGTNEYKVVKIVYHWNSVNTGFWCTRRIRIPGHSKSEILVFSFSSNTWRSIGKVPNQIERRSSQALFTNGRLHWPTRSMYRNIRGLLIICFDLADEQFHDVPRPDFSVQNGHNYHLALLRGCLCAVVCSHGELEIWVMKEYNVKESWIKELRMGAHLPELLHQKLQRPFWIWGNTFNRLAVRVLCILKNGEILVEYKVGRLALYDAYGGRYKVFNVEGDTKYVSNSCTYGKLESD